MNIITARAIKKINLLLLFFSIFILILNVFLPLAFVKDSGDPSKIQYHNLETMKYSDDPQLRELAKDLDEINLYLWIVIVVGLFSFMGLIVKQSGKLPIISNVLLSIGCVNIFFISLSCVYYVFFINTIIDSASVSLVTITGSLRIPYICLVFFAILLLCSVVYPIIFIRLFLKEFKESKKQEKHKPADEKDKKIEKKKIDEPWETIKQESKEKQFKLKEWQKEKLKGLTESKTQKKDKIEKLFVDRPKEKLGEKLEETPPSKTPFHEEKKSEFKKETEEVKPSDSFEKALTIAIEKKKEVKKEKFNIKCPQCSFIFEAEKNLEGSTKTKCPKCGKEGIIK